MRKTATTLRKYPMRARAIAETANELDLASRRLHRTAAAMATEGADLDALDAIRVKLPGCDEHGPEGWRLGCPACYAIWARQSGEAAGRR